MSENQNKTKRFNTLYIRSIRIVAFLVLLTIAYRYLYQDLRWNDVYFQLLKFTPQSLVWFTLCIILMPLNWFTEAVKWKIASQLSQIQYSESMKHVLRGVSLGIITPARIGEYAGRSIQLPTDQRTKGVIGTLLSSISQNTVHILIAFLAIMFGLGTRYNLNTYFLGYKYFAGFLVFILVIIYWNIGFLSKTIKTSKFLYLLTKKWNQDLEIPWENQIKIKVLALAFIRFLIYTLQYIFVLLAFGCQSTEWILVIGALSLIFAVHSLVPLAPFFQIPIRGSIAIFFLGPLISDESIIFLSSYSVWLINLLIPSILGSILLLRKRIKS